MLMLLLRSVLSIVKKAQRERKTSGEIVAPTGKEKRKKNEDRRSLFFFQSLSFSHFRSAKSTREKAQKSAENQMSLLYKEAECGMEIKQSRREDSIDAQFVSIVSTTTSWSHRQIEQQQQQQPEKTS